MASTPRSNITRLSYLLTLLLAVLQFPPLLHASDEVYSPNKYFPRGNDSLYISCSNSTDGLSQTYGQDLVQLFRSLVDSVNHTGFSSTSVGESTPYAAYGLSLCRDDLTADRCRNCAGNATQSAKLECPNNWSAMIWIGTDCLLHFSDTRFFGTFNQKNWQAWAYKVSTRASDNVAQEFLYGLVKQTGGNTSYGMAQCTRDLTIDTCNECLRTAYE